MELHGAETETDSAQLGAQVRKAPDEHDTDRKDNFSSQTVSRLFILFSS